MKNMEGYYEMAEIIWSVAGGYTNALSKERIGLNIIW
jgi:hypothetical protein